MSLRISGMVSGMDTDTMVKELVNAQKIKNKRVSDDKTRLTWKQDKWKELNAKLYKLYTEDVSKLRLQSSYQAKAVATSNDSLVSVTASTNAPEGAHNLIIDQLASAQYVTGAPVSFDGTTKLVGLGTDPNKIVEGDKFIIGDKEFVVGATSTVNDFINAAKEAGVNANFDETNKRIFLSSKVSGVDNGFQLRAKAADGTDKDALLNNLGLDAVDNLGAKLTTNTTAVVVAPANSEVTYNGALIENSSNIITLNGLTVTLKGESAETISLSVSNDVQATYDKVKEFVKSYNEILEELNSLYYADSSKGYNPLSDEEKEAMSEDQIEKWENKIKDSILRRDPTLGDLITTMKGALTSQVTIDGNDYSLSSYGIMTSFNYMEKGLLHIYGDAEDSTYALKEDKLLKGIKEDPDTVMKVLSGIVENLYDDMNAKMKSVPNIRSALTFYNDKAMNKRLSDYDEEIADLEERLLDMEERYYQQFSAMETALSKLQSQSSSLLSMLGTGQ
jgi:flagellar hook-associated protein 2